MYSRNLLNEEFESTSLWNGGFRGRKEKHMRDIKKYGRRGVTVLLSSAMVLTLPGMSELKVQAAAVINRDRRIVLSERSTALRIRHTVRIRIPDISGALLIP